MAKKHTFDYDLIVIGSGAGGSAAATIAARSGKRVAVIEAGTFGGESPNWGDVPTKALLHAAQLYDEAKHGARFGIRSSMLGYNYPSLHAWKDLTIKRTGAGGNRRYYENEGISAFNGIAHFLTPNEISVNRRHLSAEYFLVATGAHIEVPDIPGIENIKYLTPRTILQTTRPPKSLFVVGGGTTGIELAQLMAIFGTKVYVAEIASRLLPQEDEEVGVLMERTLKEQKGITPLTQTRIISVIKDGVGKRVTYTRGGVEKSVHVDEILIATGRVPTVDLGLENASVEYTPKGVEVNEYLQTSARHIYAAGEVLGHGSPTHTALLESRVVAHNILHPKSRTSPNYAATPTVTFTYPGVASVGLNEDDCLKRDLRINKAIAPLNIIARSNTSDFRDGFVKIITDKKGVVLGATVVAPHAAEIIHELALAVKHGLTATDIASTPHAFLSWSEAVRVAAAKLS
ncbi:NAD(P)/FAD-dependent oxidoreductase [Streptomyces caniscabiei]|uniref:dihydrolipoyl dehydrogenase family protein n=1 Tax=Streptomyces caniscabiei TaxID=2746961 RepID=UPI0029B7F5FF|nr:NAD(P)/FAD-dependent oxidoreductase [Streptomyces caniscabiei]MDX2776485.1 NAD(P)/FAD-dependent oxidoreductase [Streptomyces caniscabiei]